jgi:flagellum-specific peptidoglycan hydrolase FlgJ
LNQQEFVSLIAPAAQDLQKEFRIFASVSIAQACLETGYGKFLPVDKNTGQNSYNFFGVKGVGPAGYVVCSTWEVYNGKKVTVDAKFRAYNNVLESLQDHHKVLMQNRYIPVRQAATPEEACQQLQKCGYATDPQYPDKLISIMNQHNLKQYDVIPEPVPGPFPDVPGDRWSAGHIQRAKDAGWMKGFEDGTFGPEQAMTREQMAVILARMMNEGLIKG